jgi:hypothetical protein
MGAGAARAPAFGGLGVTTGGVVSLVAIVGEAGGGRSTVDFMVSTPVEAGASSSSRASRVPLLA